MGPSNIGMEERIGKSRQSPRQHYHSLRIGVEGLSVVAGLETVTVLTIPL
jgi:hypothetical protein